MFDEQKAVSGYAALRASDATILGVWDDHDYNCNDGDSTHTMKDEVKPVR
jgi:hypothetical protein